MFLSTKHSFVMENMLQADGRTEFIATAISFLLLSVSRRESKIANEDGGNNELVNAKL